MSEKTRILQALGESSLTLPPLVNEGLAANDRLKYCFALLQTAQEQADHPSEHARELIRERHACGLEAPELDAVPREAQRRPGGYLIPHAARLRQLIERDLHAMLAPITHAAQAGDGDALAQQDVYQQRLEQLLATLPAFEHDEVPAGSVSAMTRGLREHGDSIHLLVMDLHRELNRLQTRVARESIDGARVYAIDDQDRPLVSAFMSGLNRTAPLKFEHPGLGTTATRAGQRLVIQNDIGTTDAHVLVVHVEGLECMLTYTDIHIQRALFFQSLFEAFDVVWEDTRSRRAEGLEEGDTYYLCVGSFAAKEQTELERYLAFLGSRIVFLIDWNRARKRLRYFVGKRDGIGLLRWAADNDFGHRGFLELGGERLIFDAVDSVATLPLRYGQRLDEVLGRDTAVEFLRFVLRRSSEGLRRGRSQRLIRDEIKAELLRRVRTSHDEVLALCARHATLVFELAELVQELLLLLPHGVEKAGLERAVRRARLWEQQADELLNHTRAMVKRSGGSEVFADILEEADDAADGLEEAVFLLTLLARQPVPSGLYEPVQQLGRLLAEDSRELVKCFESAAHVHRGGAREDLQDVLEAVDRIVTLEHETDDAQRRVTAAVVEGARDFRQLHLLSELGRVLEAVADSMAWSAQVLREHILEQVAAG